MPIDQIGSLDWLSPRVVPLTDLVPTYEFTPFLGESAPRWSLGLDSTPDGLGLRLGGSAYDRGISMHSRSKVTYAIPAGSQRFEAVVGLDDGRGRLGSVTIGVQVDGKPVDLGLIGDLTAAKGPVAINVPLELRENIDVGGRLWDAGRRTGTR